MHHDYLYKRMESAGDSWTAVQIMVNDYGVVCHSDPTDPFQWSIRRKSASLQTLSIHLHCYTFRDEKSPQHLPG